MEDKVHEAAVTKSDGRRWTDCPPCIRLTRVFTLESVLNYGWRDDAAATTAGWRRWSNVAESWHVCRTRHRRQRVVAQRRYISYTDGRHRTLRLCFTAPRRPGADNQRIIGIGWWRRQRHWTEYFSCWVCSQRYATQCRCIIRLITTVIILTIGNKTNAALLPPINIDTCQHISSRFL